MSVESCGATSPQGRVCDLELGHHGQHRYGHGVVVLSTGVGRVFVALVLLGMLLLVVALLLFGWTAAKF